MLSRLEKLKTLGEEPAHWCKLLKPVLSRFVRTFDNPRSADVVDFWQRIAHFSAGGSGPSYYSGWITAFCFWDKEGKMVWQSPSPQKFGAGTSAADWQGTHGPTLRLDGTVFHRIESDDVPPGWSSVPVKVDDNGYKFNATMIAGSVGIKYASSGMLRPRTRSGWTPYKPKPGGGCSRTRLFGAKGLHDGVFELGRL